MGDLIKAAGNLFSGHSSSNASTSPGPAPVPIQAPAIPTLPDVTKKLATEPKKRIPQGRESTILTGGMNTSDQTLGGTSLLKKTLGA